MLIDSLNSSYGFFESDRVVVKIEASLHHFKIDTAIPCGLIINELLTNCYKYAFPDKGKKGEIKIVFSKKGISSGKEVYKLIVEDNGVGISPKVDVKKTNTLGLQLVHMLVEQLDGDIRLDRRTGTKFIITLKKNK